MKINIDDLDIYQKTWNYGMQKIAASIIAAAYNLNSGDVPITKTDYQHLVFKGFNPMDMNESFEIQLKIVTKISFKHSSHE